MNKEPESRLGFLNDMHTVTMRGPLNANPVTLMITSIERVAHTHTEDEIEERILAALFEARRNAKKELNSAETNLAHASRKADRAMQELDDIESDIIYIKKKLWPNE